LPSQGATFLAAFCLNKFFISSFNDCLSILPLTTFGLNIICLITALLASCSTSTAELSQLIEPAILLLTHSISIPDLTSLGLSEIIFLLLAVTFSGFLWNNSSVKYFQFFDNVSTSLSVNTSFQALASILLYDCMLLWNIFEYS